MWPVHADEGTFCMCTHACAASQDFTEALCRVRFRLRWSTNSPTTCRRPSTMCARSCWPSSKRVASCRAHPHRRAHSLCTKYFMARPARSAPQRSTAAFFCEPRGQPSARVYMRPPFSFMSATPSHRPVLSRVQVPACSLHAIAAAAAHCLLLRTQVKRRSRLRMLIFDLPWGRAALQRAWPLSFWLPT